MLYSFINLDVRTLIMVLFFGNMASVALICSYYFTTDTGREWSSCRPLVLAKFCQGLGLLFIVSRGQMHPLLSVNFGNTISFIGFFYEAMAIQHTLKEGRRANRILFTVLILSLVAFNGMELIHPDGSMRVVMASLIILSLFIHPCYRLLLSPNTGKFKRCVGAIYAFLIIALFPRALSAMMTDMSILSNTIVQTLTFMSMIIMLIFSLPALLLLIKEDADIFIKGMAGTDMLTGLRNRYYFFDIARRIFCRTARTGGRIAILFLDIDFFKKTNDSHGHIFGDSVLASLGRAIRDSLRPDDLSCRYGGEEFVILLPDTGGDSAVIVAERIRAAVGALDFPERPDFRFTVSVGVFSDIPAEADNLESFISHADAAMYMAKRRGRDRVVRFSRDDCAEN